MLFDECLLTSHVKMVQLLIVQMAESSVDDCLLSADYSPTYKILLKADAESTAPPVCKQLFDLTVVSLFY